MVWNRKRMLISLLLSMFSFTMLLLGLTLLAAGYGLSPLALASLSMGLTGLIISAVLWIIRPKSWIVWPKCFKRLFVRHGGSVNCSNSEVLDRDKAEMVMKNIRGIPYLIQAIQYSMETTYYTAMMAEAGDGMPTTSVIHTAPKCISVIDSDHEECCSSETVIGKGFEGVESMVPAARSDIHVADQTVEEWIPTGSSSWNNTQLRISVNSNCDTGINVFPYSEAMPRRSGDAVLELIETPAELSPESEEKRSFLKRPNSKTQANNGFQLRYMAMSGDFLHKFNESFRDYPH